MKLDNSGDTVHVVCVKAVVYETVETLSRTSATYYMTATHSNNYVFIRILKQDPEQQHAQQ